MAHETRVLPADGAVDSRISEDPSGHVAPFFSLRF